MQFKTEVENEAKKNYGAKQNNLNLYFHKATKLLYLSSEHLFNFYTLSGKIKYFGLLKLF